MNDYDRKLRDFYRGEISGAVADGKPFNGFSFPDSVEQVNWIFDGSVEDARIRVHRLLCFLADAVDTRDLAATLTPDGMKGLGVALMVAAETLRHAWAFGDALQEESA